MAKMADGDDVYTSGVRLNSYLAALGWTRSGLARRLYLHPNTVGHWKRCGVPGYVLAYLKLAVRTKDHAEHMLAWVSEEI